MQNRQKERNGDLLRWAKANMEKEEYRMLISSKDTDREAYDNSIYNLKILREKMEGSSKDQPNQQRKPKQNTQQQKKKAKSPTSFANRKIAKEKVIKNNIAVLRKKHREYTKEIVPLEVAFSKEKEKLFTMSENIKKASEKVIGLENREEEMLEKAKYVCKTYPKTLMKAKKLLDACVNDKEKEEIQKEYNSMMKELSEQRDLKTKLDGKLAKFIEGSKVILTVLFKGSSNRTILQEIKLSAGGY